MRQEGQWIAGMFGPREESFVFVLDDGTPVVLVQFEEGRHTRSCFGSKAPGIEPDAFWAYWISDLDEDGDLGEPDGPWPSAGPALEAIEAALTAPADA